MTILKQSGVRARHKQTQEISALMLQTHAPKAFASKQMAAL